MELENLKLLLNDSAAKDKHTKKNNIMELIQNKSCGPLAMLEKKFKWNFYTFPFVVIFFTVDFIKNPEKLHSPSMWMLIAMLVIISGNFAYNYMVVKSIQRTDISIKENMSIQITRLEKSFKWYAAFSRYYLIVIAILLEVVMYYHLEKDFEPWYHVNIFLRLLAYAGFITLAYFVNRRSFRLQYGQYLEKLKHLVGEL